MPAGAARRPGSSATIPAGRPVTVSSASQLGGSLGLAVLATAASTRAATQPRGSSPAEALASGYDLAFLIAAGLALAIAALSLLLPRRRRD